MFDSNPNDNDVIPTSDEDPTVNNTEGDDLGIFEDDAFVSNILDVLGIKSDEKLLNDINDVLAEDQ